MASNNESGEQTAPRGRGAIMLEAFKKRQSVLAEATSASTPSVSRGRAAFLDTLRKVQQMQIGKSEPKVDPLIKSATGQGRGARILQVLAAQQQSTAAQQQSTAAPSSPTVVPTDAPSLRETPPVIKMGSSGTIIPATANYIRLKTQPGKGLYEYDVRYDPPIDSRNLKFHLLNQKLKGTMKIFDGSILYLPSELPEKLTIIDAVHPETDSSVKVSVAYRRKKRIGESIQFYNLLFHKIFKILKFVQMGRRNYDPTTPFKILQHRLEIWPGFVTAVDEYEGGVMLCIDSSHRVLRMDSVKAFMMDILHSDKTRSYKQDICKHLIGTSVLTRYNNKLYIVDDILWDMNPTSTFSCNDGSEMSYVEYYRKHYCLEITDLKQPLIANKSQRRLPNSTEKVDQLICLIPELCYMTGLTDPMRNNFTLMKDIASYTRITPNQRILALNKFCENIKKSEKSQELLNYWGLQLAEAAIDLQARVLTPESITFGNNVTVPGKINAEWSSETARNKVISAIDLVNWVVMYTPADKRNAENFAEIMEKLGPSMGIRVNHPYLYCLKNDATPTYVAAFNELIKPDVQILVIICPTSRDDRYAVIKKICCADKPIASQVINSRTLNDPRKVRSVVQKIALQINCKLGGQLWSVKLPRHKWMICGIDTYHDKQKTNARSVSAFVASLNNQITRWYSQVCFQSKGVEMMDGLKICLTSALRKTFEINGNWPSNVIIFRDGVGDGQLQFCKEHEVVQLYDAIKSINLNNEELPKLTFVVVQKRINTRLFITKGPEHGNPGPGTFMDHTITRRDWYDFFLVSQNVRQGTVSPSHYVVLHDESSLTVDQIQRITYKMCHLYYNWPGTVRVPAPCQYAHKLAYLVGQSIHKTPSDKLADRLYFL